MFLRLVLFVSAVAWTLHSYGAAPAIALVAGAVVTRALLTRSGGRGGVGTG